MSFLKDLLKPMAEDGSTLTREQARSVLIAILDGQANETEAAALLSVLATRGELAPELAGFVEEIRARATPIPLTDEERDALIDTCGTGGGGPATFNISTGAALVVAAAGAKVAKHGNRAVTSRCGSADVLEALGIPIALSPDLAAECLRETGFVFLLATMLHPAMKAVAPLRKTLGFRTIFNLCGPLTNPAGARSQVIGTLAPSRALLMARTLVELNTAELNTAGLNAANPNSTRSAFIVHGLDGMDELTLTGESIAVRFDPAGEPVIKAARVTPEMAGLPRATLEDLSGGNAEENAAHLYDVITGIPGPRRDIVLFNTAAALVAGGQASDLKEGVAQAAEAIDSGMAAVTLQKLRSFGERYKNSSI
ncbi:MAG TPA: anthranilate phosphoribosyltransferase [Acidobacteriaceae bacterium]|nr:anthranilate phosphoribosyltransferase [Acidobacteriaceae bacterium]